MVTNSNQSANSNFDNEPFVNSPLFSVLPGDLQKVPTEPVTLFMEEWYEYI